MRLLGSGAHGGTTRVTHACMHAGAAAGGGADPREGALHGVQATAPRRRRQARPARARGQAALPPLPAVRAARCVTARGEGCSSMWRRLQPHVAEAATSCVRGCSSMRPGCHSHVPSLPPHAPCLPQVCTQVAGATSRTSEPLAEPLAELRGPGAAAGSKCRLGSATAHCPGLLGWTR